MFLAFLFVCCSSCSSTEKPLKEMVFSSAAMKAAQRERAERKAPDMFRRAELKFWSAKRSFSVKDYEKARKAADEAKRFAEQAEIRAALEALNESY